MKTQILLTQASLPAFEQELDRLYQVHRLHQHADKMAFLKAHGAAIRGVVTGGALGLSNTVAEMLPALEVIAINGVGTDAVDLAYARKRGIHVTTTPNVLTADVADLALGLMIAALRGICTGDRYVRAGQWGEAALPLAHQVSGKRVGIVGMGRVGQAIARRVSAFDCPIAYTNRGRIDSLPYSVAPDLHQLARESDVLILAASADDGKAIIDMSVFDALGPDGVLINVARGKLVDEADLVQALQEGRIAGAGLDVFADEPRVPEALWTMENVVLLPHRASATEETRQAMGQVVLDNLAACFAGRTPPARVAIQTPTM
jgi:hydroxypyruvate reductase